MNKQQREEMSSSSVLPIIDKCLVQIVIEGMPRDQALCDGAVRAEVTKDTFQLYVFARLEGLLQY